MRKHILFYTSDETFTVLLKKAVRTLSVHLESFGPTTCFNMAQLALLRSADLLLLDLEGLPEVVFEQLSADIDRPPVLIFTDHYTVQQYRNALALQPLCFLTKTGPALQIRQAIELQLMTPAGSNALVPSDPGLKSKPGSRVYIKTGKLLKALEAEDITFVFSENKSCYIRYNQQIHATNYTITELEEQLSPVLVRVHRSFLVNPLHISVVFPKRNQIEVEDTLIPIGDTYRESFLNRLRLL